MTETMIPDAQPVVVARKPIERRGGVTFIGGTTVRTREVYAEYRRLREFGEQLVEYVGLTAEQTAFAIRYEAKKAKRKDPIRRQLKANGRATKQRGYRCEKKIEGILSPFGFMRVIMSGALGGDESGDLRRRVCDCGHAKANHLRGGVCDRCLCENYHRVISRAVEVLEVKRRQDAQRFLRDALAQGGAHAVVVDPAGGQEPLFVMTLTTATHLLREAGYQIENGPDDTPGAASTTQGG